MDTVSSVRAKLSSSMAVVTVRTDWLKTQRIDAVLNSLNADPINYLTFKLINVNV